VVVFGLCTLDFFTVLLQYLRSYALAHTTNRIDVEFAARSLAPKARPMTELVIETRLKPKALAINVSGHAVPLTAGMTVSVKVKTGSRRLIEYVFSPPVEVARGAMRER
jgi:hypothetical protein